MVFRARLKDRANFLGSIAIVGKVKKETIKQTAAPRRQAKNPSNLLNVSDDSRGTDDHTYPICSVQSRLPLHCFVHCFAEGSHY
jgi:hypothetical protein